MQLRQRRFEPSKPVRAAKHGRCVMRLLIVFAGLLLSACRTLVPTDSTTPPALIPIPAIVQRSPGIFTVRQNTLLNVDPSNPAATHVARYFVDLLAQTRDVHLDLRPQANAAKRNAIVFVLDPHLIVAGEPRDEGYELSVSPQRILLVARSAHGLFNGAVTLWQLLTQSVTSTAPLTIGCLHIEDYPRFAWRGLMLDSARHFQSPQFIKHLLDQMALHKLNVFHWHLTDDQGWRIQIKRYPKLTEVGAWRIPAAVNGTPARYGGFYTQDEIRDIVSYAAARHITIVPEIEMPGHAQAAIAAYPQLGVTGMRPPVSHDWGVHTYLYNVDDATFDFLENVLREVMDLFPGQYIHIGGDEAAKDQWQASAHVLKRMHQLGIADTDALQSYFITRIGKFLDAHARQLIGWDEILKGGLPPSATVMSWQGDKGGIAAAKLGHDVVMAPSPLMYFDHVQSSRHDEPPGRPDVVSLADVYAFDPLPAQLDALQAKHVLGAQANLWTEYMDTPQRVEHAAFPRVAALAEVLWSPVARHNWSSFLARLPAQLDRYRDLDVQFADSAFAPNISAQPESSAATATLTITNQSNFGAFDISLDGSAPNPASRQYTKPINVPVPVHVRAQTDFGKHVLANPRAKAIDALSLHRRNSDALKSCKPGAGLPLRLPGPAIGGGQTAYRVDIFDPCWIYPEVDLQATQTLEVAAAQIPYNFQLWHDASNVVLRKPTLPDGELQVHRDTCDGPLLASIALAGAPRADATALLSANWKAQLGLHDLCLYFTRDSVDPMWVIDSVQLLPKH